MLDFKNFKNSMIKNSENEKKNYLENQYLTIWKIIKYLGVQRISNGWKNKLERKSIE